MPHQHGFLFTTKLGIYFSDLRVIAIAQAPTFLATLIYFHLI